MEKKKFLLSISESNVLKSGKVNAEVENHERNRRVVLQSEKKILLLRFSYNLKICSMRKDSDAIIQIYCGRVTFS